MKTKTYRICTSLKYLLEDIDIKTTGKDFVECPYCHKLFGSLGMHLKQKHGVKPKHGRKPKHTGENKG